MSKPRKKLQECGYGETIQKTYKSQEIEIDFRVFGSPLGDKNIESFSEKSVLNFVAQSYANSCLTLFHRVEEYKDTDKYSIMDNCALRYLPAMFCFRHYIELKLKYLYMCYANEEYNSNTHNLSTLLQELKGKGFPSNVFDLPIEYIKERECFTSIDDGNDSFFRYLIDKDMKCKEHLNIPMFEFDKIKTYILDIEYHTRLMLTNKFIRETIENKKNGSI